MCIVYNCKGQNVLKKTLKFIRAIDSMYNYRLSSMVTGFSGFCKRNERLLIIVR